MGREFSLSLRPVWLNKQTNKQISKPRDKDQKTEEEMDILLWSLCLPVSPSL